MQTIQVDDSDTNLSFDNDMKDAGSVISVSSTNLLPNTPVTNVKKSEKEAPTLLTWNHQSQHHQSVDV